LREISEYLMRRRRTPKGGAGAPTRRAGCDPGGGEAADMILIVIRAQAGIHLLVPKFKMGPRLRGDDEF